MTSTLSTPSPRTLPEGRLPDGHPGVRQAYPIPDGLSAVEVIDSLAAKGVRTAHPLCEPGWRQPD